MKNTRGIETVELTIEKAAPHFEMAAATLSKRLKAAGFEPPESGKWPLSQLVKAAMGDLRAEQTRLAKENADKTALENHRKRNELAETGLVIKFCNGVGVVIRQKLLASSLSDDEKDEMLAELQKLLDAGTVTEQVCASTG